MGFLANLSQTWKHASFRKLVMVRLASQAADGTVQVGMASYVLLSPQSQPDAWKIAWVLAITLLPFSVLGPFVSLILDRWSRQRVVVAVDSIRFGLAIGIAGLVATGMRNLSTEIALFSLLLLAMSLNRFVLAGLSAGLHYTVDEDELLTASSVIPMIGPFGVIFGTVLAGAGRFILGNWLAPWHADAIVFCIAAGLFACSVSLTLRIGRHELGPPPGIEHTTFITVIRGLGAAFKQLQQHRPAQLGLTMLAFQRVLFGFIMVATILGFRNYFHALTQTQAALGDLSLWASVTGAGFMLATILVPQLTSRLGLRVTAIVLLCGLGIIQVVPGSIFIKWTLLAASFVIGLFSQSFKICVDTLVQAHIEPEFKGRVFIIYDMVFNGALVLASVCAALVLPVQGLWFPAFFAVGIGYVMLAVWFAVASARIGRSAFERGTGHLIVK